MSSRPQYAFNDGNDMQEYFAPSGGPPKAGEFQSLCAVLCDAMGFKARPRLDPGGNPVGIDVKFAGQSGYCYCMCRPPEQAVERKELQELLRAKPEIPAARTLIMTTGAFTAGAYEYATAIGIRAVGGTYLVGLMRQHGMIAETVREPEPEPEPEVRDLREERPRVVRREAPPAPPMPKGRTRLARTVGGDAVPSQKFDRAAFFRDMKK